MVSEKKKYKRFSKYLLLDHLFDGGMAEIYRARELTDQETAQVGSKIVAIKLIKQEYSCDPDYKKMFEQELKVCFGFIHPNVAQTFDYGEKNEKLYAVLEYIDGRNLKQYLDVMSLQKKHFSIPMAVYITSQICLGLDYTHKFSDKLTGKAYNLIHRDISPHNIMMSFDGLVKVIDFGIAKADTNQEKTQTGVIKGKTSYLAPEYLAEGIKLDHRYDQFAVALTLWELIFSQKLFDAKNQMAILKQVYDCNIPNPKEVDPKIQIPDELADILYQALARDPQDRFKDMEMFHRSLATFLNKNYPEFNGSDLKKFINIIYSSEIIDNKNKLKTFGTIDTKPYILDYKTELSEQISGPADKGEDTAVTAISSRKNLPDKEKTNPPPLSLKKKSVSPKKSGTKTGQTKIQRNRPDFGRKSARSHWAISLALMVIIPLTVGLLLFDMNYYQKFDFINHSFEQYKKYIPEDFKKMHIKLEKGKLSAINLGPQYRFFIDNKRVRFKATRAPANVEKGALQRDKIKPAAAPFIELDMYRKINIRIEAPGKRPIFKTIQLTKKKPEFKLTLRPARSIATGSIITTLNHSMAEELEIKIDQYSIYYSLPIVKKEELPVGKYYGNIWDRGRNINKKIKFTVKRNRTTTIKAH